MTRMPRTAELAAHAPQDLVEHDTDRRAKRAVWKPLAAAGIGGAVLLATGFGVFAQLQATATNTTPLSVNSGTLLLTLADNGAGFTTAIERVAPGDVVRRHVTLTNTGTLAGTGLALNAKAATTNNLLDPTRGLQAVVRSCPSAWTATTGTCSGTSTAVYTGPLSGLTGTAPVAFTAAGDLAVAGQAHLQVELTLPKTPNTETSINGVLPTPAGGTIQGLTNQLTFTFTETQRTETTTNS